jgi:hypothetical protein
VSELRKKKQIHQSAANCRRRFYFSTFVRLAIIDLRCILFTRIVLSEVMVLRSPESALSARAAFCSVPTLTFTHGERKTSLVDLL